MCIFILDLYSVPLTFILISSPSSPLCIAVFLFFFFLSKYERVEGKWPEIKAKNGNEKRRKNWKPMFAEIKMKSMRWRKYTIEEDGNER